MKKILSTLLACLLLASPVFADNGDLRGLKPDGANWQPLNLDASGNLKVVATGGSSGTVTSVSVTTANGVSGSVATATTTPAISLTLGAITPTTVNGATIGASTVSLSGGDSVATLTGTQTLTNKRVTARVGTVTDAATITPTGDSSDMYTVTALAQAATIAAPSGTPTNGQKLIIRFLDNATGRALTWNAIYRAVGITLPTTTTASKTTYVGCIYNSADTKFDCIATVTQA